MQHRWVMPQVGPNEKQACGWEWARARARISTQAWVKSSQGSQGSIIDGSSLQVLERSRASSLHRWRLQYLSRAARCGAVDARRRPRQQQASGAGPVQRVNQKHLGSNEANSLLPACLARSERRLGWRTRHVAAAPIRYRWHAGQRDCGEQFFATALRHSALHFSTCTDQCACWG